MVRKMIKEEGQILSDEQFERLLDVIYSYLVKQGWNRIPAKITFDKSKVYPEQSLLAHSINALSTIHRILRFIASYNYRSVSMELYVKALVVSLLHDAGKVKRLKNHLKETTFNMIKELLEKIFGEVRVRINVKSSETKEVLSKLEETIGRSLDEIYTIIKEHQGLDGSALLASHKGIVSKDFHDLYNLVLLGDVLAYYRVESDIIRLKQMINRLLYRLTGKEKFKLTYYRITTLHGIATQFLHKYIEDYITKNNDNVVPLIYAADRTFFLVDNEINLDTEKLLNFIIKNIEEYLKSEFSRSTIKNTLLIDNDKKYGLVIDPFLLLLGDIKHIMEQAAAFYFELSQRVTNATKRNNEKKLSNTYKKYELSFDATYDVILISRMLQFYYRFSQDVVFLKGIKGKSEKFKRLTGYLFSLSKSSVIDLLNRVDDKDFISIVAGLLYEEEVNGRKIKEYSNPFKIVGELLAKAIMKVNEENLKAGDKESIFEKYFKKQIGMPYSKFKEELKKRIRDVLVFDVDLVNNINDLIQSPDYYVSSKAEGGSGADTKKKFVCILCNLSGFGFSLKTQRSALSTRIFTNRNIANVLLNVRWICALCLLESVFRAIILNQKISPDDKRIYIFMMPDVLYTRLFARTIYKKVNALFSGGSSSNFRMFSLNVFSESTLSNKELDKSSLFNQVRNRGFTPLKTPDSHYIMFTDLLPKVDNRSVPDSYVWYEALCIAVTLQRLFGGKYIITKSFIPPMYGSIYTILLDGPHGYIRRIMEVVIRKKTLDSNEVSLIELDSLEKLLASIYKVGSTRDLDNKLHPSQEIPRVLKTFLDYFLPGSKFFAETLAYAKAKNKEYFVRSDEMFLESCKILDETKGGNLIE